MAVKFRSVSTATGVGSSLTPSAPSQVADGDLLIAITGGFDDDATFAAPAGWMYVGEFADSTGLRSKCYKKIASSEPASYTWTFADVTSGAINISIAAYSGGHDLLHWGGRVSSTQTPALGYNLTTPMNAVNWQVYVYRQDTVDDSTCTGTFGTERHDVCANDVSIRRGQAGYSYGPPGGSDIVNVGETIFDNEVVPSQAPLYGVHWNFLIADKELDAETWSSTNGDFAVELNLDVNDVDTTGNLATTMLCDVTSEVSAVTASGGGNADNAKDGLTSTYWFSSSATGWLQYDFGSGVTKTIKRYRISANELSAAVNPATWTLKGSNNGTDFTVLDTRSGESFGLLGETREFKLNGTAGAYRYYRLDITANYDGVTANIRVAEFRLSDIDVWEDVTTYVQEEQKIRITRGLQGSSGRSDFSRAYMTFDNTDGRFSLRNQDGIYFGALKRNTKMRISKAYGTKSLQLQGDVQLAGTNMSGDAARCALTDALSIVGDIDIRVDFEPDSWRDEQMLAGIAPPDAQSAPWVFYIGDDGLLNLSWYDGSTVTTVSSTTAVPQGTRQAVRVTLDVDNGASGSTATFYTSTSISGSWTQLGDTVVTSGVTSISYAGGALCVGHVAERSERGIHGDVYHFELRTGIAGTLVSDVDFTALSNGVHAFSENSNEWITINNAVVSNRRYRFHGSVPEWPLLWDPTGTWIEASVTAAGVQRRMEKGTNVDSALYRQNTKGIVTDPGSFEWHAEPDAYWPMEDAENTTRVSSAVPNGAFMTVYGGPPEFASLTSFSGSNPLLKLANAKLGGKVSNSTYGYADIRWVMHAPTAITAGANILTIYTSGGPIGIVQWVLDYEAADTWYLRAFRDDDDTAVPAGTSGNLATTTIGEYLHCQLILDQVGFSVSYTINVYDVYGTSVATHTGSFVGIMGRVHRINVNDDSSVKMNDVYFGHLASYGADSPTFTDPMTGWHYETAGNRMKRICREEEVEFRYAGSLDNSAFLGVQSADSPFAILSSAAVSDGGWLVDPLDAFGVEYRTIRSVYSQAAHLTLSYTGNELSGELQPVPDDSYIVNDFTASRGTAGSSRFRLTSGALSTSDVGEYSSSQSYSLAHEGQCVDIASWAVHHGTIDEDRYPRIQVALENLRVAASSTLTESILKIDIAHRVDITDTPTFLPSYDIRQIVIGYEEWFDNFQHNFTLNTIPERAFEVAEYDSWAYFDTEDTSLAANATAAATSISVSSNTGPVWAADDGNFDILIDGEQITVTAVTQTSYSSDSFDRADSTTNLGSTDGGTVQAWTQQAGTWGINSNTAYISAAGTSIATIPGAADFDRLEVTVSTWASDEAFLVFRYLDTSNYIRFGGTVGSAPTLVFRSAAVDTTITTTPGFNLAAGDKLGVRCHGSVVECFVNDEMVACTSSATHQTETIVGMRLATTAPRLNNFYFEADQSLQTFATTRAVNGVSAAHDRLAAVSLYRRPYRGL